MDDHVSLEFVLAIERLLARVALERFLVAVDQHMHLEVLFGLERLVAHRTDELICKQNNEIISDKIYMTASTKYDFTRGTHNGK